MKSLQVIVISLKRSKERKAKVASEMAKTGLKWCFLDAVDGNKLDMSTVPYDGARVKRLLGFALTPKEIGCYMSHMKAWQACVDQGQPTLIFEDDFVIEPHLESVLGSLLDKYHDWQIVRMQALCESSHHLVNNFGSFQLVRNEGDPLGATAYLVSPASANVLIEKSDEIFEPLDHYIEHHEKHGLIMTAIKPYPVTVVDPTRASSTITDRPVRLPVRGRGKFVRSVRRVFDRIFSKNPYFPK